MRGQKWLNRTENEWNEITERLTLHALCKFRKYGWKRGDPSKVEWAGPDGTSPKDLALTAITKVVEGKWTYDPQRHLDFLDFLRSRVDSLISHLAEKAKCRRTGRMPVTFDPETNDFVEVEIPGTGPDPAETCMNRDVINCIKEVVAAERDQLMAQILECMEAEITKPETMAELLGVDVKSIYNAQKRFRRKLNQAFPNEKERHP